LPLGRDQGRQLPALPAGLLCGYLAALADSGLRASTITRRAAAIAHHHRAAGREPPTASPAVREVLRGIRHTRGTAPGGKTPATAELIARLLAACPETLIGRRDRGLIALGFAGAFRRSELLALAVADLTESPDGLRVVIRRSKTDPEAQGQEIAIPRGTYLRPVETLQAWLAAAGISDGPLFRPVTKGGTVGPSPLGADGFVRALKRRAEAGADALKMAEVSRHKSLDTLRRYVRRSNLFKAHAGAGFL
jgi:integrase